MQMFEKLVYADDTDSYFSSNKEFFETSVVEKYKSFVNYFNVMICAVQVNVGQSVIEEMY